MIKKFAAPILAVALVLATLVASVGVAFAANPTNENNEGCQNTTITVGEKVTYSSGNIGIFMPSSGYAGELEICRNSTQHPERTKDSGLLFVSPIMYWNVERTENTGDAYLHGNTTVFFDVPAFQDTYMSAFQKGELAIYYWNPTSKIWDKLSTVATARGFSARAVDFGYYAIGRIVPATQ